MTIALRGAPAAPDSVRLDLSDSLRVAAVRRDGRPVPFTHRGGVLAVPSETSGGAREVLEVIYDGRPSGNGFTFARGPDGPRVASYGMPYHARQWWPSHDVTADKADSADILVTVPDGLLAVSNGRLVGRSRGPARTSTFHWAERHPIYPDVVSVAIAPYATFSLSHVEADGDTLPLRFYVFREDSAKAREDFSILPDLLAFYERLYGPYPFADEKYGLAEFTLPSFREHQTIPSLGAARITGTHRYDWILAHDLAHQWFGNSLTPASWKNVWLNESFAQYSSLLWLAHTRGRAAFDSAIQSLASRDVPGPLEIADTTNIRSMFSGLTFGKGPVVLDRLRRAMGDSAFFLALRRYTARFAYGTVTTRDFQEVAERAAGCSLDGFFREWVYGRGTPDDSESPESSAGRRSNAFFRAHAGERPRLPDSSYHQFDFWIGDWDVVNRQRRPQGTQWGVTGQATDRVHAVAGGCGIVEHWRGTTAMGRVLGYSLRAWNAARKKWDLVLLWPQPNQPSFFTLEGAFGTAAASSSAPPPTRPGTRSGSASPSPTSPPTPSSGATAPPGTAGRAGPRPGSWSSPAGTPRPARSPTAPPRPATAAPSRDAPDGRVARRVGGRGGPGLRRHRARPGPELRDPGRLRPGGPDRAGPRCRCRAGLPGADIRARSGAVGGVPAGQPGRGDRQAGGLGGGRRGANGDAGRRRGRGERRAVRTRWTRIGPDGVEFETAVRRGAGAWTPLWRVTLRPTEGQ